MCATLITKRLAILAQRKAETQQAIKDPFHPALMLQAGIAPQRIQESSHQKIVPWVVPHSDMEHYFNNYHPQTSFTAYEGLHHTSGFLTTRVIPDDGGRKVGTRQSERVIIDLTGEDDMDAQATEDYEYDLMTALDQALFLQQHEAEKACAEQRETQSPTLRKELQKRLAQLTKEQAKLEKRIQAQSPKTQKQRKAQKKYENRLTKRLASVRKQAKIDAVEQHVVADQQATIEEQAPIEPHASIQHQELSRQFSNHHH